MALGVSHIIINLPGWATDEVSPEKTYEVSGIQQILILTFVS
jgi:hypothetical protein